MYRPKFDILPKVQLKNSN